MAVSEHANKTGHIPVWDQVTGLLIMTQTGSHIGLKKPSTKKLHSMCNTINRDNRVEIPEAWMTTIKKHDSLSVLGNSILYSK